METIEKDPDLEFYNGNQWPEEFAAKRRDSNRPVLTINRIPMIVAALAKDQGIVEGSARWDWLVEWVVRHYTGPQLLLNYAVSNLCEVDPHNADLMAAYAKAIAEALEMLRVPEAEK